MGSRTVRLEQIRLAATLATVFKHGHARHAAFVTARLVPTPTLKRFLVGDASLSDGQERDVRAWLAANAADVVAIIERTDADVALEAATGETNGNVHDDPNPEDVHCVPETVHRRGPVQDGE